MKSIAIIPARSGSKGLKDKNIKIFNGKPLLAYSIESAIQSNLFHKVIVSTDSMVYANIGREFGADVPFLRNAVLSTDDVSTWDVVKDVLRKLNKVGEVYDIIAVLQPTSPLRDSQDILNAFKILLDKDANAVVSVCEVDHSPLWTNKIPENGSLNGFIDTKRFITPRQQLEKFYRINGAIYLLKTDYFHNMCTIYDSRCYSYVMNKYKSIDIDDEIDFKIAEYLYSISDEFL